MSSLLHVAAWLSHVTHMEPWTLFGRLPFTVAVAVMYWSVRRHAGTVRAGLALSGFAAGAALGTAVLPSIIGAVAGAALGWIATLRVLGVRRSFAYIQTRLLLLIVGIGRFGCFVAGCCFGKPSDTAWAVQYGPHSLAHALHLHLGLVGPHDDALPVLPVQLYEGAAVLAMAAALPLARRALRSDRAVAFGTAGLYLLLRAALDPLRGMVNTRGSASFVGPLSVFQWELLLGAAVAGALMVYAVRSTEVRDEARPVPGVGVLRVTWCVQALAALLGHSTMTPFLVRFVLVTLTASLAMVGAALATEALGRWRRLAPALAVAAILLAPLLVRATDDNTPAPDRYWTYDVDPTTNQLVRIGDQSSSPVDLETAHQSLVPVQRPEWHRALTLYGGGGWSQDQETSCNGPTSIWQHAIYAGGMALDISRDSDSIKHTFQLRLGVFGDNWKQVGTAGSMPLAGETQGLDLMGTASFWYQFDWRYVGFGVGGMLALGRMNAPDPLVATLGNKGFVLPGLYLRLGPPMIAFEVGTGSIRQYLPASQIGVLWTIHGNEFRFGGEDIIRSDAILQDFGPYFDARFRLGPGFLQMHLSGQPNYVLGTVAWTQPM